MRWVGWLVLFCLACSKQGPLREKILSTAPAPSKAPAATATPKATQPPSFAALFEEATQNLKKNLCTFVKPKNGQGPDPILECTLFSHAEFTATEKKYSESLTRQFAHLELYFPRVTNQIAALEKYLDVCEKSKSEFAKCQLVKLRWETLQKSLTVTRQNVAKFRPDVEKTIQAAQQRYEVLLLAEKKLEEEEEALRKLGLIAPNSESLKGFLFAPGAPQVSLNEKLAGMQAYKNAVQRLLDLGRSDKAGQLASGCRSIREEGFRSFRPSGSSWAQLADAMESLNKGGMPSVRNSAEKKLKFKIVQIEHSTWAFSHEKEYAVFLYTMYELQRMQVWPITVGHRGQSYLFMNPLALHSLSNEDRENFPVLVATLLKNAEGLRVPGTNKHHVPDSIYFADEIAKSEFGNLLAFFRQMSELPMQGREADVAALSRLTQPHLAKLIEAIERDVQAPHRSLATVSALATLWSELGTPTQKPEASPTLNSEEAEILLRKPVSSMLRALAPKYKDIFTKERVFPAFPPPPALPEL